MSKTEQILERLPHRIRESEANYAYLEMFKTENGYVAGYYNDSHRPHKFFYKPEEHPTLLQALTVLEEWYLQLTNSDE